MRRTCAYTAQVLAFIARVFDNCMERQWRRYVYIMIFSRSLLFSIVLFFTVAQSAFAGFGVTPPYVTNPSLTRNSIYEQKIYLVRSNPDTDLKATISIDVPGVNDWFTVN